MMSGCDIIFTADGYVSRSLAPFGVETKGVGAFYIFLLSFLFLSFFFLLHRMGNTVRCFFTANLRRRHRLGLDEGMRLIFAANSRRRHRLGFDRGMRLIFNAN